MVEAVLVVIFAVVVVLVVVDVVLVVVVFIGDTENINVKNITVLKVYTLIWL